MDEWNERNVAYFSLAVLVIKNRNNHKRMQLLHILLRNHVTE